MSTWRGTKVLATQWAALKDLPAPVSQLWLISVLKCLGVKSPAVCNLLQNAFFFFFKGGWTEGWLAGWKRNGCSKASVVRCGRIGVWDYISSLGPPYQTSADWVPSTTEIYFPTVLKVQGQGTSRAGFSWGFSPWSADVYTLYMVIPRSVCAPVISWSVCFNLPLLRTLVRLNQGPPWWPHLILILKRPNLWM